MKRIVAIIVVALLAFGLAGCATQTSAKTDSKGNLDLSGWWIQDNSAEGEDQWMSAHIAGNTISVYWVGDGGTERDLFWFGTLEQPEGAPSSFEWVSVRQQPSENEDTSRLSALGEKTFSYDKGEISFDLTTNGEAEPIVLVHEDA